MSDSGHVLNREAQCFPARLGIRVPRGSYRAEGKSGGLARRARSEGTGSGPEAEVRGRGLSERPCSLERRKWQDLRTV